MSSPNPSLPFLPPTLPLLPLTSPKLLFPFLNVTIQLTEDEIALVLKAVGENGRLDAYPVTSITGKDSSADAETYKGGDSIAHRRESSDGALQGKQVIAKGERMLAVVPVVEIERRVGRWATAARIKSIAITSSATLTPGVDGTTRARTRRTSDAMYTVTLEGIARIRLPSHLPPVLSLLPPIPLTRSSFALPLPLIHPLNPAQSHYTAARLLGLARPILGSAIVAGTAKRSSSSGGTGPSSLEAAAALLKELETRLTAVPVGLLTDVLATMLDLDFEVRVDMLGLVGVEERYERLEKAIRDVLSRRGFASESTALIRVPEQQSNRINPSRRVSSAQITSSGGQSRSSAQDAQAQAQAQIPEDLQPLYAHLHSRLSISEIPPQAQEAIERELTRLLKIPPQSAEYGVGKTYVELLLALPWDKVSPDIPADGREGQSIGESLERAREELEREHEGLEGVKKRVLEYLAVYRLKKRNFEQAQQEAHARTQAKEQSSGISGSPDDAESVSSTETANGSIDASTASELLELIPESQRQALSSRSLPPSPASADPSCGPVSPPPSTSYTSTKGQPQFQDKGPTLLLVGPPGVGKTSIARSLASAMGRSMHRISLGGVRDEAEIRGHRRTYVGALPGLLVSALKRTGVSNPLILLDELDKVSSSSHRGDPAAALLEALDPEQNGQFHDHYLGDVTVDLSRVVFVATANEVDPIPPALLDRCEVIQCEGYSEDEKVRIAQRFLVGKQCKEAGMGKGQVRVEEEAIRRVVEGYTMESGVRNLERQIGKLIRAKAVEYAKSDSSAPSSFAPSDASPTSPVAVSSDHPVPLAHTYTYTSTITPSDIPLLLGPAPYEREPPASSPPPGIVHGLGYRGSGMGSVLVLEAIQVPGTGKLKLTGSLGEVIRESAELALSWVRMRSRGLGIQEGVFREYDIHLHLPSGAVKKDGPSAGIAMAIAFVSLLTGRPVPSTTACTGEITLRGAVTAVGGIREKLLAAHRAGMTKIIMSHRNEKDTGKELGERVKRDIDITFIRTIEEGLEAVWGPDIWVDGRGEVGVAARL